MKNKYLFLAAFYVVSILSLLATVHGVESLVRFGIYGVRGADVYYDAVHGSRHLWNRANKRHRVAYHTVSGFSRFYNALHEEGFDVHVETYDKFNRKILSDYDVFFIGEQTYHARFMTEREQKDLIAWVKDGGSLFTLIEHTNAHYMAEVFETLYKDLPVKVRRDSIGDINQSDPLSPTWVDLTSRENHPTNKGVKEFRFYNGASLDTPHGVLFSMETSWSDKYNAEDRPIQNGNKRRDPDEISGPLAGAAAFDYGKGKVVVISDHNAMSNPTMYWGDHYRFVMNSMKWLAGFRLNLDIFYAIAGIVTLAAMIFFRRKYSDMALVSPKTVVSIVVIVILLVAGCYLSRPKHYDFFVHTGNESAMKYMTKRTNGYFTFYGQWTKEPQLRPWASRELKNGYDALFLSAPRKKYSSEQITTIDKYLSRGKTVVYLATVNSLESDAGRQLMKKFGFEVSIDRDLSIKGRRPFNVRGPREWTESIFRMYIYKGSIGVTVKKGLEPIVYLTRGNYHINEGGENNTRHHFDLVSEKQIGGGKFYLFMPVELFTAGTLKSLYSDADVVRQQMAELIIRLGKFSVGDSSVYYID
ncbi:MAG: hypothetical protein GY847_30675 [Proteobacteria bacterium]|nr:hypothetical protein [Pseudomonadota bacterium]